jgi:hypothetical protein
MPAIHDAVVDGDENLIEVYDSAKHHRQNEDVEHDDGDVGVEHHAVIEQQAFDEQNGTASCQLHTVVQFHSEDDIELDAGEGEASISYQVFGTI